MACNYDVCDQFKSLQSYIVRTVALWIEPAIAVAQGDTCRSEKGSEDSFSYFTSGVHHSYYFLFLLTAGKPPYLYHHTPYLFIAEQA